MTTNDMAVQPQPTPLRPERVQLRAVAAELPAWALNEEETAIERRWRFTSRRMSALFLQVVAGFAGGPVAVELEYGAHDLRLRLTPRPCERNLRVVARALERAGAVFSARA